MSLLGPRREGEWSRTCPAIWYLPRMTESPPAIPDLRLCGAVVVYRLFDVGYAIDLGRALELLASSAPERVRPLRGEAQALQIRNPPVTVLLGTEALLVGGRPQTVELSEIGRASCRERV